MYEQTIPVVLLFNNVAANSNLTINLTTRAVRWSLGGTSPDSLGFSYNVLPDNSAQNTSAIQSISFDDDQLTVITSATAAASSSFTLTLALDVSEGTQYVQGYCTLNSAAIVYAYFGAQLPVQWRNGRISAVLSGERSRFRPVLMSVTGAGTGSLIEIVVASPASESPVEWALGPDYDHGLGLTLYGSDGIISLRRFNYLADRIVLETSGAAGGSAAAAIGLVAFVTWRDAQPPYFYLSLNSDPGVAVNAQVGNTQPQYISPTNTLFML